MPKHNRTCSDRPAGEKTKNWGKRPKTGTVFGPAKGPAKRGKTKKEQPLQQQGNKLGNKESPRENKKTQSIGKATQNKD